MKKQIYAVRELNILTSDEEAKMNYLQHARVNKVTQSFWQISQAVTFYFSTDKSHTKHWLSAIMVSFPLSMMRIYLHLKVALLIIYMGNSFRTLSFINAFLTNLKEAPF